MLPVRRNADAVIVASFDIDNNEIAQLASVGVPIVGINSVEPEARGFTAAVNIDDVQGSTLAARHLINLGHRRITYISTNREVSLSFSVQSRFDSFTACCRREGIEPQVIVCKVDDDGRYEISDVVNQRHKPRRDAHRHRMPRGWHCFAAYCSSWSAMDSPCPATSR